MVIARQKMIDRIKNDAGFTVDQKVYDDFVSQVGPESNVSMAGASVTVMPMLTNRKGYL
jgi:hypothetical protein